MEVDELRVNDRLKESYDTTYGIEELNPWRNGSIDRGSQD